MSRTVLELRVQFLWSMSEESADRTEKDVIDRILAVAGVKAVESRGRSRVTLHEEHRDS